MDRRSFLRRGGSVATGALGGALAGCLDWAETESVWSGAPLVEDRPDAVYVPASTEEMGSFGTVTLDDGAELSLHYTFPHRFWLVTGRERERVDVVEGDAMHLMASVWDPETGIVLPRQPRATLESDGTAAESYQVWSMLAQRMGFHFGNNVPVPGDGSYAVRIDLDPVAARTAGTLDGRYESATGATVEIEFAEDDVLDLAVDEVPRDRRGERDAHAPMEMGPPAGRVPRIEELPGAPLGTGRTGDGTLAGTLLDSAPAGVAGDGPYLAISARTPYNRIVIPDCSLTATVEGAEYELRETLHHDLGHHYGAVLDSAPTEGPTISVDTPPQVARHDGYETAFFDMPAVQLDAPEDG